MSDKLCPVCLCMRHSPECCAGPKPPPVPPIGGQESIIFLWLKGITGIVVVPFVIIIAAPIAMVDEERFCGIVDRIISKFSRNYLN